MIEWLGISHFFELSGMEAVAGFFTPLAVFAAFAVAQIILPARRVPGYVIDAETGQPRNYRLNGILVFVIALIVWATEITGMPRDWFYRSTVYAVAGGTVTTLIFALLAVFTQPQGEQKNPIAALWSGRVRELSFFNNRFDVKMWFYVVGGTMLSLNALSGAAYHYDRFRRQHQSRRFPVCGVLHVLRTGLLHLRARPVLHLRPDPREARVHVVLGRPRGLRMAVHPPAVGHGRSPGPRILDRVDVCLAHRNGLRCSCSEWSISRGANLQKYTFKRWPDRKFLGLIEPKYIEVGDRKILYSGFWGVARHFNYMGEGFFRSRSPWYSATSPIPGPGSTSSSSSCCSPPVNVTTASTVPRNTAPKSGQSTRHG